MGRCCSSAMTELSATGATALATSWELALRAERKSPQTIRLYSDGVQRYLAWCSERDDDPMSRTSLNLWVAGLLDAGVAPATARVRQPAVRRFASWLIAVGLLHADPFPGVKAPKLDQPVVDPLTEDELRALIRACAAPDDDRPTERLHHRRDEAIIRLMLETAIRAGEVVALETGDLDLTNGLATVRRGKGGKGRVVPIGPAATLALTRYLALRSRHPFAESADLWLGDQGKRFGYDGLGRTLRRRARIAGIEEFRPHRLRHTAAHRWLAKGGSESGLMAIAGWTRTDSCPLHQSPGIRAGRPRGAAAESRRPWSRADKILL
jgi:site-specific recombinase XerD